MRLWQFFVRKYSRTSPLKCAHILRRQYTVVQPGWQPSNRRQNFRLPADVKRANRVHDRGGILCRLQVNEPWSVVTTELYNYWRSGSAKTSGSKNIADFCICAADTLLSSCSLLTVTPSQSAIS